MDIRMKNDTKQAKKYGNTRFVTAGVGLVAAAALMLVGCSDDKSSTTASRAWAS
jgi:hypothetical protein